MKKNSFLCTVKLSGVNLNRIYKECLNKNITMYNINRVDYKNIVFDIEKSKVKQVKEIAKNQNYEFFVMSQYGLAKLFCFLTKRIGIIVGVAIFLLTTIFSSFFVWNIKIYGNDRVEANQILSVLKNNGIKTGAIFLNGDYEKIEKQLLDNIQDLSLCSIIKKGSVVIVNVKEKVFWEELIDSSQSDIVATQNMTINSISVVQGTALKKVGDSVKAGETIVAGYFVDANGIKQECKANAKIDATLWYSQTETYPKVKEVFERTGKKIVNSNLSLFGTIFPVKTAQNTFEYYEIEQKNNAVFNNNFLPFYLSTTTYYETTKQLITQNFEQDKQSVLNRLQKEVIDSVPTEFTISKTFDTITETDKAFVVTYYAQVDVSL